MQVVYPLSYAGLCEHVRNLGMQLHLGKFFLENIHLWANMKNKTERKKKKERYEVL